MNIEQLLTTLETDEDVTFFRPKSSPMCAVAVRVSKLVSDGGTIVMHYMMSARDTMRVMDNVLYYEVKRILELVRAKHTLEMNKEQLCQPTIVISADVGVMKES